MEILFPKHQNSNIFDLTLGIRHTLQLSALSELVFFPLPCLIRSSVADFLSLLVSPKHSYPYLPPIRVYHIFSTSLLVPSSKWILVPLVKIMKFLFFYIKIYVEKIILNEKFVSSHTIKQMWEQKKILMTSRNSETFSCVPSLKKKLPEDVLQQIDWYRSPGKRLGKQETVKLK